EGGLPIPFVVAEDKDAILADRPAERAAEFVKGQARFVAQQLVARVQSIRLKIFKKAAVKLVRSRFRDDVDVSAQSIAVFGGDGPLDGLHLGNAFDAHDVDVVRGAVGGGS